MKANEEFAFSNDQKDLSSLFTLLAPINKKYQEEAENIYPNIIKDIANAGLKINSVNDILIKERTGSEYRKVLPVVIQWFVESSNPRVKELLARNLTVRWAAPEAVKPLISEYENLPNDWIWHSAKWAIGNAISEVADETVFNQLINIVLNKENYTTRQMVVLALGNMQSNTVRHKAIEVLKTLLKDSEMTGHAIIALRKLKATEGKKEIELVTADKNTWIRIEAKKTISEFNKISKNN